MRINKYHLQVLIVEALAIVVACLVVLVGAWVRTLPREGQAQAFLQELTALKVGQSTLEQALSVAQKHGGRVEPGSGICTYEACRLQWLYENKPLSSTYSAPYTALVATIEVKNGIVTERHIRYSQSSRPPIAYNVREAVLPAGDTPEARGMRGLMGFARMNVDNSGVPSAISIGLQPSTNEDERRRAYALNVSCLSKILGCSGPSAIFPSAIPYRGTPYQTHSEAW